MRCFSRCFADQTPCAACGAVPSGVDSAYQRSDFAQSLLRPRARLPRYPAVARVPDVPRRQDLLPFYRESATHEEIRRWIASLR